MYLTTQSNFWTPSRGLAIEGANEVTIDLVQYEPVLEVGADLANYVETQTSPNSLRGLEAKQPHLGFHS